jgi:hypothetical protein
VKKLEWTAQGLVRVSPAVGVRSLLYPSHDPWDLVSSKEEDGDSHNTQTFLAWRAEWASDSRYSAPDSKGYKAVMADLTAFLAAFTEVFKDFHTSQGSLKQTSIKVAMDQTIPHSKQMVLREDPASEIECLMLEPGQEGQDALLVEDALDLLEKALKTSVPFA